METAATLSLHCDFPHDYEVRALPSYSLLNPAEQLYQFPAELEEGDRSGLYVRVLPDSGAAWIGFFFKGFDSQEVAGGIYSCPDPGRLCVVVGGYAYLVEARNPAQWLQIEQRPVVEVRPLPALKLLLFAGFTTISGLGELGHLWTTERLSWEGLTISEIRNTKLIGLGWDMMADKEVPFEVDLLTGTATGGARPTAMSGNRTAG